MTRTPLLLAALTLTLGCTDKTPSAESLPPEVIAERQLILTDIARNAVLTPLADFDRASQTLATTTGALADGTGELDAARQAWRDAMVAWQELEPAQFGPLGLSSSVAGGADWRDEIHSWPLSNTCRVDQETVEGNYADTTAFINEPINVRGLDALEYLLFTEGTENTCAPNATLNTDGSWAALSAEEIQQRRADYAHALAQILAAQAAQIRDAYDPDAGDFFAQIATAGTTSATYDTTQEAFNAISDALFYLDKETKDLKIIKPAGLDYCTTGETCLDALESPFARHSKENIIANLRGAHRVYRGGDAEGALGFDDLLRTRGAVELAGAMDAAFVEAIAAVEAIPGSLHDAIQDDFASVQAAVTAIRGVTDLLKTQFVGTLDLELPQRAEGDND